ncbi:hypothetical protein [Bradyrhizobium sp. SZCCHNS3053]|uniref:hypothetical protein n=1 Tax=Bradyrhizobium sp. SZCCHNS3053 TaxID=3057322 RepID=UPI002917137C|nr:hypothetical protein [Bradyrhizobium sp. SZCCHNS3053]
MKDYTVVREFWRHGILQPVGKVLRMLEAEAKYLSHALEERAVEVEREVKTAFKRVREPKPSTVAVTEAPADGNDASN